MQIIRPAKKGRSSRTWEEEEDEEEVRKLCYTYRCSMFVLDIRNLLQSSHVFERMSGYCALCSVVFCTLNVCSATCYSCHKHCTNQHSKEQTLVGSSFSGKIIFKHSFYYSL